MRKMSRAERPMRIMIVKCWGDNPGIIAKMTITIGITIV
jgi:hypothetical protein